MNKYFLLAAFIIHFFCMPFFAQSLYKDYSSFDFKCGKNIVFEDNINRSNPANWNITGGEISGVENPDGNYISVNKYYTVLEPKISLMPNGNDFFTIEFDSYLDKRYDGNPGIFISLSTDKDINAVIGTLANYTQFDYNGEKFSLKHPQQIYNENYYDRWHHYSVLYEPGKLTIFVDRFLIGEINNCNLNFDKISVCGNSSEDFAMYFRNFRICTDKQPEINSELTSGGKISTHSVTFNPDNTIKPESMGFLNEMISFMKGNPDNKLEITAFTDSEINSAGKLAEEQAQNVKTLLINMGIDKVRITAKGYGTENNTNNMYKADGRRIEFKTN